MPTIKSTNQNLIQILLNEINFRYLSDQELQNMGLNPLEIEYYNGYDDSLSRIKNDLNQFSNLNYQSNDQFQNNLKNHLSYLQLTQQDIDPHNEYDLAYLNGYNEGLIELNLQIK